MILMKIVELYFPVVLMFILRNVDLNFYFVDQNINCD